MASSTLGDRLLLGPLVIRLRMMSKCVVAPAVGFRVPLAVLHGRIDPVEHAVEIPAAGGLLAGTIWKRRSQEEIQFFDEKRPFGKRAGLEVRIQVLFLYVDMVIFRKVRLPVVERVRCQGSADED